MERIIKVITVLAVFKTGMTTVHAQEIQTLIGGGGLHYRYTSGVNLEGKGNSGLSGVASFFALRFGKF